MGKRRKNVIKAGFFSLGCAKNLVDSQIMAGALLSEGILLVDPERADVVIVNTCAFIEDARKESVAGILSACDLKKAGSCRAVLVAGCLPQRYKKELAASLPEVDAFIGLNELKKIADIMKDLYAGKRNIIKISKMSNMLFEPVIPELVFTGAPYAYLKIAEGCNHRCSFCAIPQIRGKYRSRPISAIVKEAEQLLAGGIKELNLIAQDSTVYGRDLKNNIGLTDLVRALGRIGGKFWIRLLYGYPSNITDELLGAMSETAQVCHYLDIPIQHSHPEILRAMGRADTVKNLGGMVERIRKMIPDIALRTTCISGFPGERKEHFEHLLSFIKEVEFDHLGVFIYSSEEGTPAFDMTSRPRRTTGERRQNALMLAQKRIVDKRSRLFLKTQTEVLLERMSGKKKNCIIGRSVRLAPEVDGEIFINGACKEDIGKFVTVKYTSQNEYDMNARVVSD